MAAGYGVCIHIVHQHRAINCNDTREPVGQSARRLYGNCAISASVLVQPPQPPQGNRAQLMRLPYRGCAEMVC